MRAKGSRPPRPQGFNLTSLDWAGLKEPQTWELNEKVADWYKLLA